jgi:hypothetical protein
VVDFVHVMLVVRANGGRIPAIVVGCQAKRKT